MGGIQTDVFLDATGRCRARLCTGSLTICCRRRRFCAAMAPRANSPEPRRHETRHDERVRLCGSRTPRRGSG
eukprot:8441314-Pyramimonas_sp.AAC.1